MKQPKLLKSALLFPLALSCLAANLSADGFFFRNFEFIVRVERPGEAILQLALEGNGAESLQTISAEVFAAKAENLSNWTLTYDGITVDLLEAKIDADRLHVDFRIDSVYQDLIPMKPAVGKLQIVYDDGTKRLSASNPTPTKGPGLIPKGIGLKDKKTAEFDLSGGVQAGVNASPQYFWEANVKYPILLPWGNPGRHTIAPVFKGSASKQANADPDSLVAGLVYTMSKPFTGRTGILWSSSLFSYEFERKLSDLPLIEAGEIVTKSKVEKNSNYKWDSTLSYMNAWRPVNFALRGGAEFGRVASRSILPSSQSAEQLAFLRPLAQANLFRRFGASKNVSVDSTYTIRLPLEPEPFKRAGLNGDKSFLTTRARHHFGTDLDFSLVDGFTLSVKYRYGSLPPSFKFLDHQVTVGIGILLKR